MPHSFTVESELSFGWFHFLISYKKERNAILISQVKIWFQNHRYKTKKAQKDRDKIDQKPTALQLHHHHHHPHQSSPKRVAVPILVKDGKSCSTGGGAPSSTNSSSGPAGISASGTGPHRNSHGVSSPASPTSSLSSDGSDCSGDYRAPLPVPIPGMQRSSTNGETKTHQAGGGENMAPQQQRSSCGVGHQFSGSASTTSPLAIKNTGNSSSLAAQLHQACTMPQLVACISPPPLPPLHVGGRPMPTGNCMSNGGDHLSSSFGPSPMSAMMMTSSRHMPPPPPSALSLHETMNYADFASSRSCFFNGRTW